MIELDPLFCSAVDCASVPSSAGLYTLDPGSPVFQQTCGRIGARGSGCVNPTAVRGSLEAVSWGRVKARFR